MVKEAFWQIKKGIRNSFQGGIILYYVLCVVLSKRRFSHKMNLVQKIEYVKQHFTYFKFLEFL